MTFFLTNQFFESHSQLFDTPSKNNDFLFTITAADQFCFDIRDSVANDSEFRGSGLGGLGQPPRPKRSKLRGRVGLGRKWDRHSNRRRRSKLATTAKNKT